MRQPGTRSRMTSGPGSCTTSSSWPATTRPRIARPLQQRVLDLVPKRSLNSPIVRIGRHAGEGIVEASSELDADLIVFGWGGKSAAGRDGLPSPFSSTIDEVLRESPCDI